MDVDVEVDGVVADIVDVVVVERGVATAAEAEAEAEADMSLSLFTLVLGVREDDEEGL